MRRPVRRPANKPVRRPAENRLPTRVSSAAHLPAAKPTAATKPLTAKLVHLPAKPAARPGSSEEVGQLRQPAPSSSPPPPAHLTAIIDVIPFVLDGAPDTAPAPEGPSAVTGYEHVPPSDQPRAS